MIKINEQTTSKKITQDKVSKMLEKSEFIFDNGLNGEALVLYGIALGLALGNTKGTVNLSA